MRKIILIYFILIAMSSIITSGEIEVGYNDNTQPQVNMEIPEEPNLKNVSYAFVNSSEYTDIWITDEGDLDNAVDIQGSWITNDLEWWDAIGNNWLYDLGTTTLYFNESKLTILYFNATETSIIKGTIDEGVLSNTHHEDGNYDGITLNFSEEAGSPGLDFRINFTNIDSFNNGVLRYYTSSLSGDSPIIQLWNYDISIWEDNP